ncbi:GNAT family N-acetyltransferase [Labedaea rhizosphaerae]|uniref:Ribosomal protein S18 acetylase RimI-like enzyme n=1 Tax=Labedaea rhizosphaerae TaxID=598644 RepID=A0A4R6S8B5_LABRH|nr:GNAT family N-acetyltransferase [Labedaea rhizosphaerae]TDP95085.1 ribosomal protein S18 acetylase RimI-like enzyme [Labedaea rhizosphaerae]
MAASVILRDAAPGDGPGLAQVWLDAARLFTEIDRAFFRVPDRDGLEEWFEQLIARPREGKLLLVADLSGEVAGHLAATLHPPVPHAGRQLLADLGRHTMHVDVLAVAERWRRNGVGRALMDRAMGWARANGAVAVSLETELDNPSSMAFYEKTMGMRRQSVVFRKVL